MQDVDRRIGAIVGLSIVIAGCVEAHRPALPPSAPEALSSAPVAPPGPTEPTVAPRHPLAETASCPLHWEPREVGSVLRIPAVVLARPMNAVVAAACRCVRPGEAVDVVGDIDFSGGRVVTTAREAPGFASCFAEIPPASFEPWKTDGLSDCIDCGPRRYGVFRGSPPVDAQTGEGKLRVVFPLRVDRTGE